MLSNEDIIEKVRDHDKHLDQLTNSIRTLVEVQKETNHKIERLIEGMQGIALLNQKVSTMDNELKESFKRVHGRSDKQEGKIEKLEDASIEQNANIKSNQKRLDRIDASLTWISRTVIGAIVTGAIAALFILARGN